jgi:hypothetical protein
MADLADERNQLVTKQNLPKLRLKMLLRNPADEQPMTSTPTHHQKVGEVLLPGRPGIPPEPLTVISLKRLHSTCPSSIPIFPPTGSPFLKWALMWGVPKLPPVTEVYSYESLKAGLNWLLNEIIASAVSVHSELGMVR